MKSFDHVSELHAEALMRFARSYLNDEPSAADVVRDTLERARDLDPDTRDLRPLLYRTARELCLQRTSGGARGGDGRLRTSFDPESVRTASLARRIGVAHDAPLDDWMARLATEHQEVLRLRYAEDLSRSEIAEVLAIPPNLVKTRLYEGLRRLRALART